MLIFGAIPQRSLPEYGWPKYGIPGNISSISGGFKPDYHAYWKLRRLKEEMDIIEIIIIMVKAEILN